MITAKDWELIGRLVARQVAAAAAQLRYRGVYKSSEVYAPGNFVTHRGCVWHCNIKCLNSTPGNGPCWTMAVKGRR